MVVVATTSWTFGVCVCVCDKYNYTYFILIKFGRSQTDFLVAGCAVVVVVAAYLALLRPAAMPCGWTGTTNFFVSCSIQTHISFRSFADGKSGSGSSHSRATAKKQLCSLDIIHLQINKVLPIYFIHTQKRAHSKKLHQTIYFADTFFFGMKLCDFVFLLLLVPNEMDEVLRYKSTILRLANDVRRNGQKGGKKEKICADISR